MGFRYARKRKQGIVYMQKGIQKKWACRKSLLKNAEKAGKSEESTRKMKERTARKCRVVECK